MHGSEGEEDWSLSSPPSTPIRWNFQGLGCELSTSGSGYRELGCCILAGVVFQLGT